MQTNSVANRMVAIPLSVGRQKNHGSYVVWVITVTFCCLFLYYSPRQRIKWVGWICWIMYNSGKREETKNKISSGDNGWERKKKEGLTEEFRWERKTPDPWDSYSRNSMESTISNQLNSSTNITTMVKPFAPPTAMDPADPMQVTSSKGVGRGRFGWD